MAKRFVDAGAAGGDDLGMKGTVAAYEPARGVGLIAPEEGGASVGFRIDDVEVAKGMAAGEEVVFTQEVGDWYADRIRLLSAPRANRSRFVAAFLAIVGGIFGLQKFYLGYRWTGVLIFLSTLFFWWLGLPIIIFGGIGFVEAVIYLALGNEAFERRYLKNRRAWF